MKKYRVTIELDTFEFIVSKMLRRKLKKKLSIIFRKRKYQL